MIYAVVHTDARAAAAAAVVVVGAVSTAVPLDLDSDSLQTKMMPKIPRPAFHHLLDFDDLQ